MKYRTKLYLILLGIAALSSWLGLTISLVEMHKFSLKEYRSKAISIAATTAALIDGDGLKTIQTIEDKNTPKYIEIRDQLRAARSTNQRQDVFVIYMYILRPAEEGKLALAVTAADTPQETIPIGEIYESERSDLIAQNVGNYYAPDEYVEDQWGTWLSGYAPIFDSNDQLVGTLGVDISAEDVQHEMLVLLEIAIYSFLGALLVAGVTAFFLSKLVTSSLTTLCSTVKQIGEGDFDTRVQLKAKDEFGDLANEINMMAKGLKEREQLKLNFARYVSSYVLEKALKSESGIQLEGERKKITVLFCDIRNFTELAEKISPESVVKILNTYFEKMIEIIFHHNGTLDKFLGDGIMVEFGAPLEDDQQEKNAILAALEMQKTMESLSKKWADEGKPPLHIGIGIHTGAAVVGNIGSEKRMEYTAIGDTVNVASRLEQATKTLNVPIIVSESTYAGCAKQFQFEPLGDMSIRGRKERMKVYTPIGFNE